MTQALTRAPRAARTTASMATLMLGANMGDRLATFWRARVAIASRIGRVVRSSSIFETVPEGLTTWPHPNDDIPLYLNMAVLVEVRMTAHEGLAQCADIEAKLGRSRTPLGASTPARDASVQALKAGKAGQTTKDDSPNNAEALRAASRPIDIDIIFWGAQAVHDTNLVIPHPRYATRKFVLAALLDLDPQGADPVSGASLRHHLHEPTVRAQPEPRIFAAGW